MNKELYKYRGCVTIPPLSMIDDVIAVTYCSSNSVKLNAIIGAKLNDKLLLLGEKKCASMHVGRNKSQCKQLQINGSAMKTSSKEQYLGSTLSSDGKNTQNILDRHNKGLGIVNQIMGLLKEVNFGHFYFEMALLFRNSMLINGMLYSIEAAYGLRNTEIDQLEMCDKYLFRKMFNSISTTPIEAFYLESGTLPLRFVISARRLMFYWCLLNKPETELAKQVLQAQMIAPNKDDWICQVRKDLNEFNILLTDSEISKLKKESFKNLVMNHVKDAARIFLVKLKDSHSKSKGLDSSLVLQPYLQSKALTLYEKQLLFKFRTYTYECKGNFRNKYKNNMICTQCNTEDTQQHLLSCSIISDIDKDNVTHEHIFESLEKQIKVLKVLKIVDQRRSLLAKQSSNPGSHVHLRVPHMH